MYISQPWKVYKRALQKEIVMLCCLWIEDGSSRANVSLGNNDGSTGKCMNCIKVGLNALMHIHSSRKSYLILFQRERIVL
jgi:hypothetical protein